MQLQMDECSYERVPLLFSLLILITSFIVFGIVNVSAGRSSWSDIISRDLWVM